MNVGIKSHSSAESATGGGPQPSYTFDANNHITTSGVSYDSAGNITNDGFHSYAYDAEGRLTQVDGGSTARYVYNASGQRVQSITPSNTVDFIVDQSGRGSTEASSGSWKRSELFAGGLHVGSYTNGTTYFDHSDWLGTVRALSTVTGANFQNCSSLTFGDAQTCTGSPWYALQFTGDEHDNESNLEHTLFRQYSTTQGRWTVPDPAGMAAVNPADPQTWNRYAYVGNRPLNATDSLGLFDGFDPICDPFTDPFLCGSYCPPEYESCGNPGEPGCAPFIGCGPGNGGGGNGGGGGGRGGSGTPSGPPPPQRTGGVYANNETLGLPPGINFPALSLGNLLGLNPNGPCDFGVCAPVGGNGFAAAIPLAGACIAQPEICGGILISTYIIVRYGPQIVHTIKDITTAAADKLKDIRCENQHESDLNRCRSLPNPAARA